MEISKSLQDYLDFGVYHFEGVDYIEGKNAEIVMSGSCIDKESGEEGEFDILDVQNGKYVKAIITGSDLTCRVLTKEELRELQSDSESTDEEDTDEMSVTIDIDINEIFDSVLSDIDTHKNNCNQTSMENLDRDSRYERIEEIRKSNSDMQSSDAYHDSLSKLSMAVFGDRFNRVYPVINDTSYGNVKKLAHQCWANFTSMDNEKQKYLSDGFYDVRLALLSTAPLIEDEKLLNILVNYNSTTYLTPLDNSLFADARKKMQSYNEIYEKIDVDKEYKRSTFVKDILKLYPNVFDGANEMKYFAVTPEALLTFWHMYGKIDMYKKGRLYYFQKIKSSTK